MIEGWYVVFTKAKAEAKVAQRLEEQNLMVFLPTLKTLRQWSDRKKWIEVPLFRSYVFVFANHKAYETVRKTEGVVNFVCNRHDSKPALIQDKEIEAIREFLHQVKHETLEMQPNDAVYIHSGILIGKQAIIERIDKNHLRLRIDVLHLSIYAEIDKEMVRKI